jgi:hypothetical protein
MSPALRSTNNFLSYASRSRGVTASVLVVASGVVFGYFFWRTYLNPLPPSHRLDFGDAKWIQLPTRTEGSYYRKNLYVPREIERAWVSLSTTGSYELTVNDVIVDTNKFPGARPSGVYDITRLLARGKNVIAIYVPGEWWTGYPQIRVRGMYSMPGGASIEFVSDSSWRVSNVGGSVPKGASWSAPEFDDSSWPQAVEDHEPARWSSAQGITFDPELIEARAVGNWISGRDPHSHITTFSYELRLNTIPHEAWLQIASNGTYDVLINRQLAAVAPMVGQALLFAASAPVVLSGRVFSIAELPRVFGPSSGLPGTNDTFASVRVPPTYEFIAGRLRSQTKPREKAVDSVTTSAPGIASLPSYQYSVSSDSVAGIPKPPVGSDNESLSQFSYSWNPRLLQQLNVPSERAIAVPLSPYASPLAMPELSDLAPPPAPVVGQVIPLTNSPGPEKAAALALTGYEISDLLHSGTNLVTINVDSAEPPAVILANGFLRMPNGDELELKSDSDWTVAMNSEGSRQPARVVGKDWTAPWGSPVRVAAYNLWLPWRGVREAANCFLSLVAAAFFTLLLWISWGKLAGLSGVSPERVWDCDALLHLPILLAMLGCWLVSYDARLPYDWCFRWDLILAFAVAFLLIKLASSLPPASLVSRSSSEQDKAPPRSTKLTLIFICALLITVGFALRVSNLKIIPLGHDEVELALSSEGIFTLGFPHIVAGSYLRLLSTYELVTYPLALSSWICGPSVLWFRLPALMFGTLTIGLIGLVGYRLFDARTGVIAAAVWTFLPIPINWSVDGFYPSQEAFFALLTFWLFYEAIREHRINPRYLRLSTIAFIFTYLSWEAAGFILFALMAALAVLRWKEWDWIRDGHLWRCVAVIGTVVVLQLCFRQLTLAPDYLGFIRDLSQLTTPAFVPLDRLVFDPFYYIDIFFLAENHVLLTILTLAGLVIAIRKPPLLYLNVLLAVLYLCYTCFLEHYAPRYCFNWLPLLVLAAVASVFSLFDRVEEITQSRMDRVVKAACLAGGLAFLVLGTNQYVLRLFRASSDPADPVYFDRVGVQFKPNYGDADRYVASHRWPDDVVISRAPHVYLFATGRKPDYCFDPRLTMRLLFDGGQNTPGYIDKWLGVPQIRSLFELKDVQARAHRVWIISDTLHDFRPLPFTQDVNNYLTANGELVYESAAQRVFLLSGVAVTGPGSFMKVGSHDSLTWNRSAAVRTGSDAVSTLQTLSN